MRRASSANSTATAARRVGASSVLPGRLPYQPVKDSQYAGALPLEAEPRQRGVGATPRSSAKSLQTGRAVGLA